MVLSLAHDVAWQQFADEGAVVSFRSRRRARTPEAPEQQRTWVNRGRGQPAVADADVTLLVDDVEVDSDVLWWLDTMSGFEDVDAWRAAIEDVHGDVERGHLYLIRRVAWRGVEAEQRGEQA